MSFLGDYAAKAFGWVVGQAADSKTVTTAIASGLVIKGKSVPLSDVKDVLGAVSQAFILRSQGKSSGEIATAIAPSLINVAEDVASLIFPYGGTAVAIAVWIAENSRPMTFDEEQAWMKRASDAAINGGG